MQKPTLNELTVFVTIARERSFTRAAAHLGASPSALSHSLRGLEERLGVRLLTRTTRNVATTEAGERLLHNVGPRLDEIDQELTALASMRDKPAGRVRLTATEHAARSVLLPAIARLLPNYPDIQVEIVTDNALTDIVSERFDAGVRSGDIIAKDMIAVPIGPPLRMAAVAAPGYFATRPQPRTPHDLIAHNCINLRLMTHGGIYVWEFEKDGRELNVRVEGQLVFNTSAMLLSAALEGLGIAFFTESHAAPYVESGALIRVLADWCEPFPGYHIYYPSRRQPTAAFSLLLGELQRQAHR